MLAAVLAVVLQAARTNAILDNSVLKLQLPTWDNRPYSAVPGEVGVAWKEGRGGLVAFGPDPATSRLTTLTHVALMRSVTEGARADALEMVLTFEEVREQQVDQQLQVARSCRTGVCRGWDKASLDTELAHLEQQSNFLSQGYRPVERAVGVQVTVPLRGANASANDTGFPNTVLPEGAAVLLGQLPGDRDLKSLNYPGTVAAGLNGAVYVADTLNNRIICKGPGETLVEVVLGGGSFGFLGQLERPHGVAVGPDGAVYVADTGNQRVLRKGPGEAFAEVVLGGKGRGNDLDQLDEPEKVAVGPDGAVYVADTSNHRVLRKRPHETLAEVVLGGKGQGDGLDRLDEPSGLAVDVHGAVYVADRNNHRILRRGPGEAVAEVVWGLKGRGDDLDQLCEPCGVAVGPNGSVYVADYGNQRVLHKRLGEALAEVVFGGNGVGKDLDQLYYPYGVAVGPDGAVYVADTHNHRVLCKGPGEALAVVLLGGKGQDDDLDRLDKPSGVAVGPDGAVYVADRGNHRVLRKGPGEALAVVVFGGQGRGDDLDQLNTPFGVAVGLDGSVYVTDCQNHRVLCKRPGEALPKVFLGGKGRGDDLQSVDDPGGVSVGPDGAVYVADCGNDRVLRKQPNEALAEVVLGGNGQGDAMNQLDWPDGVAVGPDGAVYVADSGNHRVLRKRPHEALAEVVLGGKGPANGVGQLNSPRGLAVDVHGAVYVTDYFNHRVLRKGLGEAVAEVVLGGKGPGSDVDQLNIPLGVAVDEHGSVYVSDVANNVVLATAWKGPLLDDRGLEDLAHVVRNCSSARAIEVGGPRLVVALGGDACARNVPRVVLTAGQWGGLRPAPAVPMGESQELSFAVVEEVHLGNRNAPFARRVGFPALLAVVASAVVGAHAVGGRRCHAALAALVLAVVTVLWRLRVVKVPFDRPGQPWRGCLSILGAAIVPWAVAPVYVYTEMDRIDPWSTEVSELSCSLGVAWELHLFTACMAAFSISAWSAVCAGGADSEGDEGADSRARPRRRLSGGTFSLIEGDEAAAAVPQLPGCLKRHLPARMASAAADALAVVRDAAETPVNTRLRVLLVWAYSCIIDQYQDMNCGLVYRACGFLLWDWSLVVFVVALVLQNFGGAVLMIREAGHSEAFQGPPIARSFKTVLIATMCLAMPPPLKLLGYPGVDRRLGVLRIVTEDIPQLVFQSVFTYMVKRDRLVILKMILTLVIIGYVAYDLTKAPKGYVQHVGDDPADEAPGASAGGGAADAVSDTASESSAEASSTSGAAPGGRCWSACKASVARTLAMDPAGGPGP